MRVKDLMNVLKTLDQDAIIDMASDEEGNSMGDIGQGVAEGNLKSTGEKVYTLYPESTELSEDRYEL